jgi:hypothetical protein
MGLSDYIELMSLGKGQSRKEVLTTLRRSKLQISGCPAAGS